MERITHLSAPPVVGRFYLVPTVEYPWLSNRARVWPVFLPLHEDGRFFVLKDEHYHIDPRFLAAKEHQMVAAFTYELDSFYTVQRWPLTYRRGEERRPLPPMVWRRRRCARNVVPYVFRDKDPVQAVQAAYAGQQCRRVRTGWTCPHQRWPLGSIEPTADGVIVCPLHGLRIDAASGIVEPAPGLSQKGPSHD